VTSLLAYLPLCAFLLHTAVRNGLLAPLAVAALAAAAYAGHHLMLWSFPRAPARS